jgi:cell division protein FtsL
LALGYVSVRVLVAEDAYRIQDIRTDIENQKELTERIRLQNAKLASLERVKKVATDKLAMTEPTVEAKIISLPGNGVTSPEYAFLAEKEVR